MGSYGDHLREIARRAETDGGRAAAHAMAQEGQAAIRDELGKRSHARGTVTPAPPGGPPARISGRLQASVIASMPRQEGAGRWVADAGPRGVVYAGIQNDGGTIRAHGGYLVFFYGGGWHRVKSVRLPARPYLSPPVERAQARIDEAGVKAFQRAVYG
jgi:hypothetical protein